MKKLIALMLAVVMVLSLAACGSSEPAATEAPATEAPKTETPATEAPAAPAALLAPSLLRSYSGTAHPTMQAP